jgi:O-Antigen ligase
MDSGAPSVPADPAGAAEDEIAPPGRDDAGARPRRPSSAEVAIALPGLVCVAIFILWAGVEGGFSPTIWYPGTLAILAVLATLLAVLPAARRPPSGAVAVATALLAAFTLWSFASILWADSKGDAWDGANRTLLYLAVFALFAWTPWTARSAAIVLGVFSLATAILLASFLAVAAASSTPQDFFIGTRFSGPVDYPNATCALALIAFWPALGLAARREVPWLLRGLLLAASGFLLEVGLLVQSRGMLVALPLTLIAYIVLVPQRVRSTIAVVLVAAVVAPLSGAVLDVYSSASLDEALSPAVRQIGLAAGLLLLSGAAWGLVERRFQPDARTEHVAKRAVAAGWALAVVAGVVAAFVVLGNPIERVGNAWDEFKAGQTFDFGESHFVGGFGSNRWDFWRVAVDEFTEEPLLGVGADNFAIGYARERDALEEPSYAHSLELGVLAQTGIVGGLLFFGFIALALAAVWPVRSRGDPTTKAVAALAVVAFLYWLFHGSVDWFWELPAVGGPAIAALGIAGALAGERPEPAKARMGRTVRWVVIGGAGVLLAGAAVSMVLPWLAARNVELAAADWRQDPAAAFERLDRARRLNPLSDQADLVTGAIASRLGDLVLMRSSFEQAAERNPANWYPYLELAIVDAIEGRDEVALARLREAKARNPLEPTIDEIRAKVEQGDPISPDDVDRAFIRRVEQLAQ